MSKFARSRKNCEKLQFLLKLIKSSVRGGTRVPSKNGDFCDFSKKLRKIGEIADFAKIRRYKGAQQKLRFLQTVCDFSKNFEKLEKSQFLLLRANQDISGRDTLIFSRAVFLAFVFLTQETWRKGTIKKFKCGPRLKEESCNDAWSCI